MISTGPLNVGSIFEEDVSDINGLNNNTSIEKYI